MKNLVKILILSSGMALGFTAFAGAPADAPAGTTGLCKDGTYYAGDTKKGACHGHKGVKDWYGADASPASNNAAPAAAAAPMAAKPAAPSNNTKFTPAATAAAGGGPGMVWVNESSKVFHCPNTKWYGKTKHGEYMSQADAIAKGFKPNHGKTCS